MTTTKLSRQIADFFNQVNHNSFSESETKLATKEYQAMINQQDVTQIINALQDEIDNSDSNTQQQIAQDFINQLQEVAQ